MGWNVEIDGRCITLKQVDSSTGDDEDVVHEALEAARDQDTLTLSLGPFLDKSEEAAARPLMEACLNHHDVTGIDLSGMSLEGVEHVVLWVCANAPHVTTFGLTMNHPDFWVDPVHREADHCVLPIVGALMEGSSVEEFALRAGEVDEEGADADEALDPAGFALATKELGELLDGVERWSELAHLHINGHRLYVDAETLPQLAGWFSLPLTTLDLSGTDVLLEGDGSGLTLCELSLSLRHVDLSETFTSNHAETVLEWAGHQLAANPELHLVLKDPSYAQDWGDALARLPAVQSWVASGRLVHSSAPPLGSASEGGREGGPVPSGSIAPPQVRARPPATPKEGSKHEHGAESDGLSSSASGPSACEI